MMKAGGCTGTKLFKDDAPILEHADLGEPPVAITIILDPNEPTHVELIEGLKDKAARKYLDHDTGVEFEGVVEQIVAYVVIRKV